MEEYNNFSFRSFYNFIIDFFESDIHGNDGRTDALLRWWNKLFWLSGSNLCFWYFFLLDKYFRAMLRRLSSPVNRKWSSLHSARYGDAQGSRFHTHRNLQSLPLSESCFVYVIVTSLTEIFVFCTCPHVIYIISTSKENLWTEDFEKIIDIQADGQNIFHNQSDR